MKGLGWGWGKDMGLLGENGQSTEGYMSKVQP